MVKSVGDTGDLKKNQNNTDAEQTKAIEANTAKNVEQDQRLSDHDTKLVSLESRIVALEAGDGNGGGTEPGPGPGPGPGPDPDAPEIVEFSYWRRGRILKGLPKVKRTCEAIAAARLMVPFNASLALKPDTYPPVTYEVGDYENLNLDPNPEQTSYQGTTGERPELGLLLEAYAEWMAGVGTLDNLIALAETIGSVPIHFLTSDGNVIDSFKFPMATWDYRAPENGWTPFVNLDGIDHIVVDGHDRGNPALPDGAHYPAHSYLPYLITGDEYYLRCLQHSAALHIHQPAPGYNQGIGIIYPWQQRGIAWGYRDLMGCIIATELHEAEHGPVKAPLLPSSHWRTIFKNNIDFMTKRYIAGTDSIGPLGDNMALVQEMGFLGCDEMAYLATWQQDYLSVVMGWGLWTGKFPELKQLYDFQIRQAVKRCCGEFRSCAINYNLPNGCKATWADTMILNNHPPSADGHYDMTKGGAQPHYPMFVRAALKIATLNNVEGAQAAFAYADQEARRLGYIAMRYAV